MKYHYFIASRWRNRDNVRLLSKKLREKGFSVYCFIDEEQSLNDPNEDPEEEMKKFETIVDWRNNPAVKAMFDGDMNALRDSETLIMLLPAGKSAHMEAGAAYGMGKKCIIVGEQKETESLYFIFNEWHPTIEELLNHIHMIKS
ncbi:MAG: hypothetical protein UY10_C0013G0022 [Microgenomates group bacterium GW2011_GWA2_47_8]|nr:MAG: hypothetical protein UY10_C0013G0022 [Microgenomates group bacterium GW2011_GWA2_47_8]